MLEEYKVILWDFDGVIMDSMPVRTKGFEEVLKDYPTGQVQQLLDFHLRNGGLSRYVKFRYFFEQIRGESISEAEVASLAESFSEIMLSLLIDEKLLIKDALGFIEENYPIYDMHIVSGSDQTELRKICAGLDIAKYFKTINGSPTPKTELVKRLIELYNYDKADVVLIGDSGNDHDASAANGIKFYGYNNEKLKGIPGAGYIERFQ